MNTLQKIVVVFGLAGIALASLFPPWVLDCPEAVRRVYSDEFKFNLYAFLFNPELPEYALGHCQAGLINLPVLLTIYVMIIAITVGL